MLRSLAAFAIAAIAALGNAQIRLPGGVKLPGVGAGLEKALSGPSPLTTSLNDGRPGLHALDGWEPEEFQDLNTFPRTPDRGWEVAPGAYEITVHSFCLKGYTAGPDTGEALLPAVWAGKHGEIFRNIIRRFSRSQVNPRDAQEVLWALVAKTKPSKMADDHRRTLALLATPQEITELETGGIDGLGESVLRPLLGSVDRALRPLLEAENSIRQMAAKADTPYEEFQRLAVLPPSPQTHIEVFPRGRWHRLNDRIIYRMLRNIFWETTLQYVVLSEPIYARDELGRITHMAYGDGVSARIEYDETPYVNPRYPKFSGHWIKRMTLSRRKGAEVETAEVDNAGAMAVYHRNGVPESLLLASTRPTLAEWLALQNREEQIIKQIQNAIDRLEQAAQYKEKYDAALKNYQDLRDRYSDLDSKTEELINVKNYQEGMAMAHYGTWEEKLDWIKAQKKREGEAWAAVLTKLSGLTPEQRAARDQAIRDREEEIRKAEEEMRKNEEELDKVKIPEPGDQPAVPANPAGQRDGISSRAIDE